MNYNLRAATESDALPMMQIAHEGLKPHLEAAGDWDRERHEAEFKHHFQTENISIILIENREVGYFKLNKTSDSAFLEGIYIQSQSRNKGIGSRIILDLAKRCFEARRSLTLTVLKTNPAKALYERLGFSVIEETARNFLMELKDPNQTSAGNMIRAASNADAEKITSLIFSVLRDYGLKPDPENTDSDLSDIEKRYIESGGCFDVLENNEKEIVGTVGIHPMQNGLCELRKMYLSRNEKGKGLGKALLEHALKRASDLGFDRVMLETASELKEAIGLYKKYGFIPFEADHLSERCDQAYIKRLNANKASEAAGASSAGSVTSS